MANILIISGTPIGETILASGVIDEVIKRYKNPNVYVVASNRNVTLFKNLPHLKDLWLMEKKKHSKHWIDFYKRYKDIKWDFILNIRNAMMARRLDYKEMRSLSKNWTKMHKMRHYATLIDRKDNPPDQIVWTSKEDKQKIDKMFKKYKGPVIAFTASSSSIKKNWPLENYLKLFKMLTKKGGPLEGGYAAFLGSKGDKKYTSIFKKGLGDKFIDLTGELGLTEMYEFIRRSDMYIGNDTGIMHMAAASNSLTFALFGLRDTLGEFRPTGKNVHVIHKKFLFPAWKRFLTKGEHYMSHLTPEYVYDEVVKYLDKK